MNPTSPQNPAFEGDAVKIPATAVPSVSVGDTREALGGPGGGCGDNVVVVELRGEAVSWHGVESGCVSEMRR